MAHVMHLEPVGIVTMSTERISGAKDLEVQSSRNYRVISKLTFYHFIITMHCIS